MEMKMENMFTKRELYVIDQPNETQLENLNCVLSSGRLWANSTYITDRQGYGKLLFVYVQDGRMYLDFGGIRHELESGQAFFY